jgi:hypothetical protein
MSPPKLNPIEPPWYGPVCPVVWEGRRREASPYPDLGPGAEFLVTIILFVGQSGRRRTKMGISQYDSGARGRPAWNAGRQVGAKRALKVRQIWAIRFFLDREGRIGIERSSTLR